MDSEFDTIGNVLSWLAAFGVFGTIFAIIWSLWRYEDPLEAICVEKGWKAVSVERLGTLWKVETRQGPMRFRVGSAPMNRGSVRLIPGKNYYERVWLFELEFDAPFPEDLEIERRTFSPGMAVDARLGGERSMFSLTFQVHTRGRQPVSSPVMQPRLGELLLELQETSDRLTVEKRRIRLVYRDEGMERERLEEIIDRCLRIGEEIADLAGLQHDKGEAVDAALEDAERAREVREREEARSTVEW